MKKYNKIILYIMTVAILSSAIFLSSCNSNVVAETPAKTIDNKRAYELFREIASTPRTGAHYPAKINDTIVSKLGLWGIEPSIDESGNIIVDIPASSGYKDAPLLILQCHTNAKIVVDDGILFNPDYNAANPFKSGDGDKIISEGTSMGSSSAVGITSLLSVLSYLKDIRNNDFKHGPIRALFIANDGSMNGAQNIDKSYIEDGDIMISFDNVSSGNVVLNSEFSQQFTINEALTSVESKSRQAYAITAFGFPGYKFGEYSSAPNPVKIISDILTKANGNGILFELYSIETDKTSHASPTETTVIIGLNDYELRRFNQIFKESSSSFLSDVDSYYIDRGLGITMDETLVPPEAIIQEDTSKVLMQMFGLFNTNFNSDKENRSGVFIENLIVNSNTFSADITILADYVDTIDITAGKLQEISKLSEVLFQKTAERPGFNSDPENELVQSFLDVYANTIDAKINVKHRYSTNPVGYISEKNQVMPILTIGVTIKGEGTISESISSKALSAPANTILDYITELIGEEDTTT